MNISGIWKRNTKLKSITRDIHNTWGLGYTTRLAILNVGIHWYRMATFALALGHNDLFFLRKKKSENKNTIGIKKYLTSETPS